MFQRDNKTLIAYQRGKFFIGVELQDGKNLDGIDELMRYEPSLGTYCKGQIKPKSRLAGHRFS